MAQTPVYKAYGNQKDWTNISPILQKAGINAQWVDTSKGFDPSKVSFDQNSIVMGGINAQGGVGNIDIGQARRIAGGNSQGTIDAANGFVTDYNAMNQARGQYDPAYNTQVQNIKNALAEKMAGYTNQANQVTSNYSNAITQNNMKTMGNVNALSNDSLNRGIGRSTIATTGMSGARMAGERMETNLRQGLAGELSNIENLKNTASNGSTDLLTAMSNDRESGIRALADKIIKENEAKALEAQRYTDSQSWKDKEFNQAERFHNDEMATDRYVAGLNYSNRNRETPENGYGSEDFRNGLADVDDIFKATNDTIDNTWYTGGSLEDYKIGLLSQLYNVARTLQPDEAAVMTRKLDTAVASLNKQKKSKPVNAKPRESLEEASRLPYTQWNTQVQKTLPSTGGKIPEKYRIPYYTDVDKYYKPKF